MTARIAKFQGPPHNRSLPDPGAQAFLDALAALIARAILETEPEPNTPYESRDLRPKVHR